jgi:hypothetical protein
MESQRHSQDGDRGAGDWFAKNLGPNWRATGDGIYHLAEDIVTPDDADAPEARGHDTHEPNDASEPLRREQSQDNLPEQPPRSACAVPIEQPLSVVRRPLLPTESPFALKGPPGLEPGTNEL